jgi:hypothetical protein
VTQVLQAGPGEPRDDQDRPLPCSQCDRRSLVYVGDEPRCGFHVAPGLPQSKRLALEVDRARKGRVAP